MVLEVCCLVLEKRKLPGCQLSEHCVVKDNMNMRVIFHVQGENFQRPSIKNLRRLKLRLTFMQKVRTVKV